ncbi:uroporphyrinogen-III synthase [Algimonas arctica]|uniref:uroporphyrinogen-III synthase n=1 Tax=Algimonas arctica TaxID=1479486 RepID=UPI001679A6D0|nr:uroporphyrinogen-III synthase [Algimonas arctica]
MTTKIWVTRTEPAATLSAEAWTKAGFYPIVAPLLSVEKLDSKSIIPDDATLIFTSANGVRHCGLIGDDRQVYCVGDATALMAKALGFTSVTSADGDWKKLTNIIAKTSDPIVHISGSIVRGQIVDTLRAQGFDARREIVYQTRAVTSWPMDVNQIDAVALYSPMAADILMALPPRYLGHLTAYCLSENIAAPLSGMTIRIAHAPNERALIACSETPEP